MFGTEEERELLQRFCRDLESPNAIYADDEAGCASN